MCQQTLSRRLDLTPENLHSSILTASANTVQKTGLDPRGLAVQDTYSLGLAWGPSGTQASFCQKVMPRADMFVSKTALNQRLCSVGYLHSRSSLGSEMVVVKLTPPLSFLRKVMPGGRLLSRMPKPSSSFSISRLWEMGFKQSSTIRITLHVRAVEMTCAAAATPSAVSNAARTSLWWEMGFSTIRMILHVRAVKMT